MHARMPAGTPCTVTTDRVEEPGSKLPEKFPKTPATTLENEINL
jgi:hypothetical protein